MIDVGTAKARVEQIWEEMDRLRGEANELESAIGREDTRPLVGRFFRRNCLSLRHGDGEDDGWIVWTRVDSFDDEHGAHGVEYRMAGGEWYSIECHVRPRRDDLGAEVTREEFAASVQPLLDFLSPHQHADGGLG